MLRHSPPLLTSCARVERTLLGRGGNQDLRRANRKRFGAANWTYTQERAVLGKSYPTLRQARPRGVPEAAMRVRKISAQCVLQFTPSHAAGCVLHRPVSRVIHCSELFFRFFSPFPFRVLGICVRVLSGIGFAPASRRELRVVRCFRSTAVLDPPSPWGGKRDPLKLGSR